MRNAPLGYECPFCRIGVDLPRSAANTAVVLDDATVFALVPLHHYAGIRGNSAGDQDVWHFHLHTFPRYSSDGLNTGQKVRYAPEERMALAATLRNALR